VPDFGRTETVVNPTADKLRQLLTVKEAVHIFSGIDAFELPAKALWIAIKNKLKIGVILEPFNWMGWKGKLRFVKYFILQLQYGKYIGFILAIGNKGRWCYEKTGFSKNKIFDWGYFTEKTNAGIIEKENFSNKSSLLFIGSIDQRKNIFSLVDVCLSITDESFLLNIIGAGPLENELKDKIKKAHNINYLGSVQNTQIPSHIVNADVLILPSIFDGWGAVVNEALMCGVPVIASDHCGASILLNNKKRGHVFSVKKSDLKNVLIRFLKHLPYSIEDKQEIKNWALKSISGEVAANYFSQICEYLYEQKKDRPIAPWLKKNS
jgi:glycosyltransferase involved in cell wall biosynthesis